MPVLVTLLRTGALRLAKMAWRWVLLPWLLRRVTALVIRWRDRGKA